MTTGPEATPNREGPSGTRDDDGRAVALPARLRQVVDSARPLSPELADKLGGLLPAVPPGARRQGETPDAA